LATAHLVVSATPVDPVPSTAFRAGIVTVIDAPFQPPEWGPNAAALVRNPAYTGKEPAEWPNLLAHEVPLFQGFIDRCGLGVSLEELLVRHSTNHANFLVPRELATTVLIEDIPTPHSLTAQNFTCSACLEIFDVIGQQWSQKALNKCPGLKYLPLRPGECVLTRRTAP
jgi:hypothetical protein